MTRSNAEFEGITYKHFDKHPTSYEIEAVHPKTGESIAYMRYHKKTGEIQDVSVDKEHRRKGVASGMFSHGKAIAAAQGIVEPSRSGVKTDEGKVWNPKS